MSCRPSLIAALVLMLAPATRSVAGEETAPRPGTAADTRQTWEERRPVGRSVRVITAEEIWRSNARNLPELLQREAGLWLTFVTYAGGTPINRGLTGNDLLILFDGTEINNTAYRFGPLEYLSTIDLFALERVEIVRGAAGAHGGDSLGPVIHLYTKRDPAPLAPSSEPPTDPTARAHLRYATVDKSTIAHLEAHHEAERYSYLFGATSRDIGDLRGGEETNFQRVTGYEETAGNTRLQFFQSDTQTYEVDVHVLEQNNVEQYDQIQNGAFLDYRLNPRKWALFRLSYLDSTSRSWSKRLEASVYVSEHRQRAVQQWAAEPEEILQTSDNNDVEGLRLRVETPLGERHSLTWGVDWTNEEVSAVRRRLDVLTGEEIVRGTDPTRGGQSRKQLGAWLEDRIELLPSLMVAVGARYSAADVEGTQATPVGEFDLDMSDSGVSGYVSAVWSATEALWLTTSYDHGFLLPGIDQVTSFTADTGLQSLPNSTLQAAAVDAFELGLEYRSERFAFSLAVFRQELDDLVVLVPAEVDGSSFVDTDGSGVQAADEPSWVRSENVGRTEIDGLEIDLDISLPLDMSLFALYRTSEGDDLRLQAPLAGQPPDFGLVGLRWRGSWKWEPWAEAIVRWADTKDRLAPSDLVDPNFDSAWLDGYDVFELRAGVTLPSRLRFVVTFENPSDEDYRPFGWAIAGAGRNLVMTAEYIF